MKEVNRMKYSSDLYELCIIIKDHVFAGEFDACMKPISEAMEKYPHAPHPHNLMGIVLEKSGDHVSAMKHFRAAYALDPSYLPVNHNLSTYGTFNSHGKCAFDETDLPTNNGDRIEIVYDEKGVGRVVRKSKIEYDENGVGHFVRR